MFANKASLGGCTNLPVVSHTCQTQKTQPKRSPFPSPEKMKEQRRRWRSNALKTYKFMWLHGLPPYLYVFCCCMQFGRRDLRCEPLFEEKSSHRLHCRAKQLLPTQVVYRRRSLTAEDGAPKVDQCTMSMKQICVRMNHRILSSRVWGKIATTTNNLIWWKNCVRTQFSHHSPATFMWWVPASALSMVEPH